MAENLDELLVRSGLVTQAALTAARADAARTRKRLPETLIDLGLVTERRFAEWMAQISGTPLVDPIPEDAAEAVLRHVTRAIARELQVVPVRIVEEQLFVAMVNALDREAIQLLETITPLKIRPVTGVRSEIERLVNRFYPEEEAPFDFSNQTLLRRPAGLDFLRDLDAPPEDHEFGTMIAAPAPAPAPVRDEEPQPPREESTAPTNPLIAIERHLEQIVRMIRNVEKRLDDLEARLGRGEIVTHD
jgi:hypothetical protein